MHDHFPHGTSIGAASGGLRDGLEPSRTKTKGLDMNKKLILAAAAGCAFLVLRSRTETGEQPTKWEKMSRLMDEMPEDFPPRVMFNNLAATRENSEQILAILEERQATAEDGHAADEA